MWEISFANLNMLLATIPTYDPDEKKDKNKSKDKDGEGGEETSLSDIAHFFKDDL